MSYIAPDWSAPAHIKAFSTTRVGGLSNGLYGSMNLGLHVGDEEVDVLANRRKLASDLRLPNEPVWLDQIHGTDVVNADSPIDRAVDGSYSRNIGTVCVVMTADCLPLLLSNTAGDQVAAVHVGWRGLASGVIENAVGMFDCPPEQIIAWAGPSIGPNKFEIGVELRDRLGGSDSAYVEFENDTLLADIYLLCEQKLNSLGVVQFSHSQSCTHSENKHFFSYRRDGQCGRMATLIWIDPQS